MATLEKVLDMQKKGMSDNQIAQTLMQEGVSPKEVSDSLSQAKIKSAVGVENTDEMSPSIMNASTQTNSSQGQQYAYSDSTQQPPNPTYGQQAPPQSQQYAQATYQEQYAPQQAGQYDYAQGQQQPTYQEQYAPQAQYADQSGGQQYAQGYGSDLETIRDIAKREIESSITKLRQQVELSTKISLELKSQVQMIEARLSKTEIIIQELQSAIIRKMGEYGEAISGISAEVQETQKSFSKLINPLLDKKRGVSQEPPQEEERQEQPEPQTRNSRSKDEGFKNYLR